VHYEQPFNKHIAFGLAETKPITGAYGRESATLPATAPESAMSAPSINSLLLQKQQQLLLQEWHSSSLNITCCYCRTTTMVERGKKRLSTDFLAVDRSLTMDF